MVSGKVASDPLIINLGKDAESTYIGPDSGPTGTAARQGIGISVSCSARTGSEIPWIAAEEDEHGSFLVIFMMDFNKK